jgi:signal peptidase
MRVARAARWAFRAGRRAGVVALVAATVFYVGLLALHYQPLVIVTGSMQKTIPVGSLVVDRTVDPSKLQVGDVITFAKPIGEKGVDTHRIVAISRRGATRLFRTKGDSNSVADPWVIRFDHGMAAHRMVFSVPYAGNALLFVRSPTGRLTLVALACLLVLMSLLEAIAATGRRAPAPAQ